MGQRIPRYGSLDDVAIRGVLALILLDWERIGRQLGFLVAFAVLTFVFRRLMARLGQDGRWYVAMIWLIACAFGADRAGLRTRWDLGGHAVFFAGGKLAGAHIAGKVLKWKDGEASIIGWLLQTKGLIEIIFANILLDKQIVTSETFTALLLMAVGSTMLTVPVVHPKLNRVQHRGLVNQASS